MHEKTPTIRERHTSGNGSKTGKLRLCGNCEGRRFGPINQSWWTGGPRPTVSEQMGCGTRVLSVTIS